MLIMRRLELKPSSCGARHLNRSAAQDVAACAEVKDVEGKKGRGEANIRTVKLPIGASQFAATSC